MTADFFTLPIDVTKVRSRIPNIKIEGFLNNRYAYSYKENDPRL